MRGDLVRDLWALALTVAVFAALAVSSVAIDRASDVARDAKVQARQAREAAAVACWRTRAIDARATNFFEAAGVYPSPLADYLRATVPRSCPPIAPELMPPGAR